MTAVKFTPEQLAAAKSAAAVAVAADRVRMSAILKSPEAKGREALANHFALGTNMNVADAIRALAAAPKAATDAAPKAGGKVDTNVSLATLPANASYAEGRAFAQSLLGKVGKAKKADDEDDTKKTDDDDDEAKAKKARKTKKSKSKADDDSDDDETKSDDGVEKRDFSEDSDDDEDEDEAEDDESCDPKSVGAVRHNSFKTSRPSNEDAKLFAAAKETFSDLKARFR